MIKVTAQTYSTASRTKYEIKIRVSDLFIYLFFSKPLFTQKEN